MQAYLDEPQLKQDFLAELRRHQEADAIVQGTYGNPDDENFRGCAVGCSVNSLNRIKGISLKTNDHEAYETQLGIPAALAYLEDRIFEGLPVKDAKQWPVHFAGAIRPGADLSLAMPRFMCWLMGDLEQYATDDVKIVLRQVASLYQRVIDGDTVTDSEWAQAAAWAARAAEAAWAAARAAAQAAAWAARAAEAARAAARAAWAARAAAEAAARAARAAEAARAAARAAAQAAAYKRMADKLIALLQEA